MKITNRTTRTLLSGGLGLVLGLALAGQAAAQTPPTLDSSTFFGGQDDQRGTDVDIRGGRAYLSGSEWASGQQSLAVGYDLGGLDSPAWSVRWPGAGSSPSNGSESFNGVAATDDGVYFAGISHRQTSDGVGGKEPKSIAVKFSLNGATGSDVGGADWVARPHFFPYTGHEQFNAVTTAVEGGIPYVYAAGGGQPCSYFASVVAKYDTAGNLIAVATDPGQENAFNSCSFNGHSSSTSDVVVLNGNVYAAGGRHADPGNLARPAIWKHDPSLGVIKRELDSTVEGDFLGLTAFGGDIYAVGATRGLVDYIVQKYDEDLNQLWSTTAGGAGTDVLTGVVGIGSRLFAVGYTNSEGAGGFDAVLLEIDPDNGTILSTTLFGGTEDDKANGVATDGTDLYVAGESRSFESDEGNEFGQNDLMLLRYTLEPGTLEVALDIKPAGCPNPLNVKSKGVLPVAILGANDLDVAEINVATLTLEGVPPLRSGLEDVATPFEPLTGKSDALDCTEDGADGFLDLTLKFDRQAVIAAAEEAFATLEDPLEDGDVAALKLEGTLLDGTPIIGEDVVLILKKGK